MADKSAMFCAVCGTVSVVEGKCPQCARPLKKLGRIGSITESKRATQRMISKSNLELPLDLHNVKSTPGDSDLYLLSALFFMVCLT
jgi:hypothetical protein